MLKLTMVLVFVCANAQTTRVSIDVSGGKINQDVTINRIQNSMTVSVGRVSHLPAEYNYHSSINYHDYTRKMVAMKDIDAGECIITEDVNETVSAVETLLLNMKVFNYQHKLADKITLTTFPLKYEHLADFAGDAIAEFCNGYKIFKGVHVSGKERRTSAKTSGHRNHNKKCLICILCLYETREPSAEKTVADEVVQSNVGPAVVG